MTKETAVKANDLVQKMSDLVWRIDMVKNYGVENVKIGVNNTMVGDIYFSDIRKNLIVSNQNESSYY